ncbi:hypothetical protein [Serratia rhizosphaerae]|uniref:hypothetical protein n=1 Tax=Serratia rhizosphaerae TaxID=2597702 RepID=UPI002DB55F24|nr:hypothetical protein [Serratia rhizosphaerae]MEB6336575.1 hypothetical protein [Serratia rhizosphaerae]
MKKNDLLIEIDRTINYIKKTIENENKGSLKELIIDLERLKSKIYDNTLINNPLRGFPRRYSEMYNDYLHPITNILDSIEKSVDKYLETN